MALLAFVDLLGFSSQIDRTWGTSASVLPFVLDLKDRLKEYASNPLKIKFDSEPERTFKPVIRSISDSIICAIALPWPENGKDFVGCLTTIVTHLWTAVSLSAERGFAVRGAIELGQLYWDKDDFIGPAFNAAYLMESRVAQSARIILGPAVLDYLAEKVPSEIQWVVQSLFYQAWDGLCGVSPPSQEIERYRRMQRESGPAASKYDEIIEHMTASEKERAAGKEPMRSGPDDFASMAVATRDAISKLQ